MKERQYIGWNVREQERKLYNRFGTDGCFPRAATIYNKPTLFMTTITQNSQRATLQTGPLSITADASFGGRITHFCFNGQNQLIENCVQTGSTFWPSPQSMWQWPPPAVLDSEPYRLVPGANTRNG